MLAKSLMFSIAVAGLTTLNAHAQTRLPNIVVFLTDDQSQLDCSLYGDRGIATPNMERLAKTGMVFDNAFVSSPTCAPSRASLLTGLMPARNGAEANHSHPRADIRKWPAYFQEMGYEVAAFGKVSHYEHTPEYGFDTYAHDTFHDHEAIPAAVRYLKNWDAASSKPLCLMVGTNWPHVPWPTDAEGIDPSKVTLPPNSVDTPATRRWRARFQAAVRNADIDLGTVHAAAREKLGDDSLFLFSGDHGTQWPFGKWNLYEEGIRVPLVVSWPGRIEPGTRSSAMVSWIDFLPTLMEAAGGTPPADIDGRSFLPVLRGEAQEHRDRIFTTHSGDGRWNIYPIRSVRTEQWKYIRNLHPEFAFTTHIDLADSNNLGQRGYFASWERRAKSEPKAAALVRRYHERPPEELYDLSADPNEQNNLAADPQHAAELEKLRKELNDWMRSQNDKEPVVAKPRLLTDLTSFGPNSTPPE